jgi:hypothetical protein
MQRCQIGAGRRRGRDLAQDDLRIAQIGLLIEQGADARGRHAPSLGEARIFQNGKRQLDLIDGLGLGGGRQVGSRRQVEGLGSQAPVAGLLNLGDDGSSPGGKAHRGDPQRRVAALAIGLKRGKIVRRCSLAQDRS